MLGVTEKGGGTVHRTGKIEIFEIKEVYFMLNERETVLFEYIDSNPVYLPLVQQVARLETELESLKNEPAIKVHPTNPNITKINPGGKMYKEFLQQYINAIKCLERIARKDDGEEASPLREWLEKNGL